MCVLRAICVLGAAPHLSTSAHYTLPPIPTTASCHTTFQRHTRCRIAAGVQGDGGAQTAGDEFHDLLDDDDGE